MTLKIAVLYSTTEGQTAKVAEHVLGALTQAGVHATLVNIEKRDEAFRALADAQAAVLAASVHLGKHTPSFLDFVKVYREMLEHRHTLFLPVSLSAAHFLPGDDNTLAEIEAKFEAQTGWHPEVTAPVAGALAYARYGFVKRWVMWVIASTAKTGEGPAMPTDTSRDWEFTDWDALDRLVAKFVEQAQADEVAA